MTNNNNVKTNAYKSGYIAIIGAPNAGKSTLINRILGEKISIISKKPQTTRNRIIGIAHRPEAQLIFIDTPGVHGSQTLFNIRMTEKVFSAISDVDIILWVVDISTPNIPSEKLTSEKLRDQSKPIVLALNKADLVKRHEIDAIIKDWKHLFPFHCILPISAKHGAGVDDLMIQIEKLLLPGPAYFPDHVFTDMPERFIVSELIREKVFRFTGEEIPYATAVTIESFQEEDRERIIRIQASIHVEKDSQKGIIIGKSGNMLKKIGTEARKDIENLLGVKVFLGLYVRVRKNWSRDEKALSDFGYL